MERESLSKELMKATSLLATALRSDECGQDGPLERSILKEAIELTEPWLRDAERELARHSALEARYDSKAVKRRSGLIMNFLGALQLLWKFKKDDGLSRKIKLLRQLHTSVKAEVANALADVVQSEPLLDDKHRQSRGRRRSRRRRNGREVGSAREALPDTAEIAEGGESKMTSNQCVAEPRDGGKGEQHTLEGKAVSASTDNGTDLAGKAMQQCRLTDKEAVINKPPLHPEQSNEQFTNEEKCNRRERRRKPLEQYSCEGRGHEYEKLADGRCTHVDFSTIPDFAAARRSVTSKSGSPASLNESAGISSARRTLSKERRQVNRGESVHISEHSSSKGETKSDRRAEEVHLPSLRSSCWQRPRICHHAPVEEGCSSVAWSCEIQSNGEVDPDHVHRRAGGCS